MPPSLFMVTITYEQIIGEQQIRIRQLEEEKAILLGRVKELEAAQLPERE